MAIVQATYHAAAGSSSNISVMGINAGLGNAVIVILTTRDSGGLTFASSTWNGGSDAPDESIEGAIAGGLQFLTYAWAGLTGTATLALTMTGSVNDLEAHAFVISGADTADLLGTLAYTDGATSPAEATVTSASNGIVLSAIRLRADLVSTLAVQSEQTLLDGPQLSGNGNTIACSSEPGAAFVTSGYTFDDSAFPQWAMVAVPVNGTGGPPLLSPSHRLLMMGVG